MSSEKKPKIVDLPDQPGALFGDDAMPQAMAKIGTLETLLNLQVRDCSYNDFAREILLAMMKVVRCEAGSFFEVNPSANCLFFRAVVGRASDKVSDITIPMGKGIVGFVAESRQPILVSNAKEHDKHLGTVDKTVGFETANLIAIPISIRGKIFGVIELINRVGEPEFTTGDLELLSYLCRFAARAIECRLMIAHAAKLTKPGRGNAA